MDGPLSGGSTGPGCRHHSAPTTTNGYAFISNHRQRRRPRNGDFPSRPGPQIRAGQRPAPPSGWRPERRPRLSPREGGSSGPRCFLGARVPRPGLCKSFAPRQLRPPDHPAAVGAQRHQDDHDLPANGSKCDLEGGQKPAGLPVAQACCPECSGVTSVSGAFASPW
jgi:hypothetical protein